MFEFKVNGRYANRNGEYTVLTINDPKMRIRYDDGNEADVSIRIQARIWEHIAAEREAEEIKTSGRRKRKASRAGSQRYLKVISVPLVEEFMFPGWRENVMLANDPVHASRIKTGDQVIYYALETQTFFAVVAVTGSAKMANPQKYGFTLGDKKSAHFFPVEVDAAVHSFAAGVACTAVELESLPDFRENKADPEELLKISEDDFEIIIDLLTELSENEDDPEDEIEDLDDDIEDKEDVDEE